MIQIYTPQAEFPVEETAVANVRGYEAVLAHLGHWPSFHDMEVISMRLDRVGDRRVAASCDVTAEFYIYDLSRAPDDPERKQALLELLFSDVCQLSVSGWNHQNPISGLSLRYADGFFVSWGGCGHDVKFTCRAIAVLRLRDLNPYRQSQLDGNSA